MEKNHVSSAARALFYLISCELEGKVPERTELLSAESVYSLAKYNGLGAIVASSLKRVGLATEEMFTHLNASIRKTLLFNAARAEISKKLSERGIWHLPLKGVILQELYPSLGLRQMSDNDLLFDPTRRDDVRKVMTSLGYTVDSFGSGCHDVYLKEPVYNFEMHVALFAETESRLFTDYFKEYYGKTLPTAENTYLRTLKDEDLYLYVKAHEYKHYSSGGTGPRALVDTYLFLRSKGAGMNKDYLSHELSALGIADYEREVSALAEKLLSPDGALAYYLGELYLTEREERMLSYFLGSGTYGNLTNKINNELDKLNSKGESGAKGKYVLSRLFPPMEWYKVNAPFYYKHKILIPFYVIARLFKKVLLAPRKAFNELRRVINAKKDKNK